MLEILKYFLYLCKNSNFTKEMEEKDKLKDKYIDPFTDFGFKKLFGEECNKDTEKYRYDVMLTDIDIYKIFYDKLTFTYLEMPKFNKKIEEYR